MSSNFSFLINRKKLLILSFTDLIIILFSWFFLSKFNPFLYYEHFLLIIYLSFWILTSYVFGRYEIKNSRTFIYFFSESLKVFLITAFIFIIQVNISFIYKNIDNYISINYIYINLITVSILSLIINLFLRNKLINFYDSKQQWLIIAKDSTVKKLREIINCDLNKNIIIIQKEVISSTKTIKNIAA